ncbi:hypothetical protein CERSUDRAFT_117167 [Gelatoporia subvermispora B]|uniref:Scaffold protein Tuba n=1 Tax=Ceriporiopsis subvermispora (strain B) TaxID=914234 RepID=M2QQ29_CERS8|nr:hypothetical protein CERSUDRAFT_117167 [Gelatoporia subvermispora B]
MLKESPGAATPSAANGGTNPFFKSQPISPEAASAPPAPLVPPAPAPPVRTPSVPPPSKSPAPAAVKATYHTAPGESEDDWDEIEENDVGDSSEDELDSSRDTRNRLAQQLFGSILPPSRPQSAAAPTKPTSPPLAASPNIAPPPPPPPPSAPPAIPAGSDTPVPPPPPFGAPATPPPPPAPAASAIVAPQPSGDRNALLSAIQSGARLRKAQTNDRSAAALSGKVLGDAAPPPHVTIAPREPSPPPAAPSPPPPAPPALSIEPAASARSSNRESVDWYAGLAADGGAVPMEHLPPMQEEEEPVTPVPHIQVNAVDEGPMADIDKTVEYRVRSLYAYEGQRPEDLSFGENLILTAHPSKSGSDWWHGTLVKDGKAGFFPNTYVERIETVKAKALYAYAGNSPDELPFEEGDELTIVDRADSDWWKADQGGVIFIVPAGYLEIVEGLHRPREKDVEDSADLTPTSSRPTHTETAAEQDDDSDATDSDYLSSSDDESDDDDEEQSEEAHAAEREARELERQRVLEAAGFIIKSDAAPPPTLVRQRSHRKRRPPPAVPERTAAPQERPTRDLPQPPHDEPQDSAMHLHDAFERYEAYKQANLNRLSVISVDTTASEVPPPTPTIPRSPSAESTGEAKTHSFLSFFGRSRTPAHEEETKTRPTISAPILQKDPSSTPTDTGSAFGSTWGSLIDSSALEEIPPRERRRQEAIFELIATEAAYVRDLQLIVEVFYANLLSVLDPKAITVIFANVEDLLLTNTTFLSCLEERQKECRLYVDRIGDILKSNMAQMTAYMEYCINQATAAKVLQSMRQSNPELGQRLQRLREDPAARNLDLSSYLLSPMQRITRYPLLIKQIVHYTDPSDDRKQVERALKMAEKILEHINEAIREQEGRERLKVISQDLWIGQGRLDLTAPTRYMGPRKLLREGLLMKAKSGRKLRAFLCSDILVLTEDAAKTLYRTPIPLSGVQVSELPGGRDDLCFQIAIAYPRGGDTIALRATSARDCHLWMQAIDHASRKCRDAEKRALRKAQS